MSATVKLESEVCALCSSAESELFLPEEYDAGGAATPTLPPMRNMLLHLAHSRPLPEGSICNKCAQRAVDAYEFSTQISSHTSQPLSEKIRNLRKRLHQLTQRIDVFIVVGAGSEGGYQEEDIIMVQKEALAAAVAADEQRVSRWTRDEFQCSQCPKSFKSAVSLSVHARGHSPAEPHWCWACGARSQPHTEHEHCSLHLDAPTTCHLCTKHFESAGELCAHTCACPAVCPLCGCACVSRAALATHARSAHARTPPTLCPLCFLQENTEEERLAHSVRHRADTHYVCGALGCLLRFRERSALTAHVRSAHGAATRTQANTSIGNEGLTTRGRARTQGQQGELQTSLVNIEPESASAYLCAPTAAHNEHEANSTHDDVMDDTVEYLEMDTFDDD